MPRNVLGIVNAAAGIIGLNSQAFLVGNTDPAARAMIALFNRAGQTMTRMRNTWGAGWTALTREYEFETTPGVAEYALPDDFEALIDGTVWNRSVYREARGVLSPQQWQEVKGGLIETVSLAPLYRIRRGTTGGRALFLDPTPQDRDTLVFEYASRNWLQNAARDAYLDRVAADTDLPLFDDDLLEMSILWRFKQSRGLTFAAELAEYEQETMRRLAEDAGARSISIGRGSDRGRRRGLNVPETISV